MKSTISVESLSHGLPEEFGTYLAYIRSLDSEELPDYDYLRRIFRNLFSRLQFENDHIFDWTMLAHKNTSSQADLEAREDVLNNGGSRAPGADPAIEKASETVKLEC